MSDVDKVTLELINQVKEKRSKIAEIENPVWKTNCLFSFGDRGINIRTLKNDLDTLVSIAANVKTFEISHKEACKELGVNCVCKFLGYKTVDWMHDIKNQINKLVIQVERDKLQKLEDRLDKIITPELKRQLEIEAIQKELSES